MRRLSLIVLVFALVASPLTMTWGFARGGNARPPGAQGVNLAGSVLNDGKTLLADDDNPWSVNNADALKSYAGEHVTVKCRMDPGKRSIRVLYVVEPETRNSANLRDSAYRR